MYPTKRPKPSQISNAHLPFSAEPTYYSIPFHILSQNSNGILHSFSSLGSFRWWRRRICSFTVTIFVSGTLYNALCHDFIVNLLTREEWLGSFIRSFYREKKTINTLFVSCVLSRIATKQERRETRKKERRKGSSRAETFIDLSFHTFSSSADLRLAATILHHDHHHHHFSIHVILLLLLVSLPSLLCSLVLRNTLLFSRSTCIALYHHPKTLILLGKKM